MERVKPKNRLTLDRIVKMSLLVGLLILAGYFFRSVLTPLIFSFFLAMLVLPICNKLERIGMNRLFSSFVTVILLVILFAGGITYLSLQFNSFLEELPNLKSKLINMFDRFVVNMEELFNVDDLSTIFSLKNGSGDLLRSSGTLFKGALSLTSSLLTFFGLVPIYVFLILFYRNSFKTFLQRIPIQHDEGDDEAPLLQQVKSVSQDYLIGLALVILIIAILNTTGLLILGIKFAIPLGIISAVLTVIPYIGVVIGAGFPVLVAFLTKDSLWYPIGVICIYAFVQFIEGNFITPNIVGSSVDINPLAAIVGLIIGGMMWGIVGMILAIPLLAIVRIICEHIEDLKPFAILLDNKRY